MKKAEYNTTIRQEPTMDENVALTSGGRVDKLASTDINSVPRDIKEENYLGNNGIEKEHIPVQNFSEEEVKDTRRNGGRHAEKKVSSVWARIKSEASYREKVFLSLSICWSFIILGWIFGQFGPSFLDLQIITSTSLEMASGFLTAASVGHLVGSLISGILFDKFNKILLLFCFTVSGVIVYAAIPWCFWYELMIAIHFIRGLYGGGLDAGGNALLIWTWGQDGRSFMQALHFAFAFGGIISPLVTAPFLLEEKATAKGNNSSFDTSASSTVYTPLNYSLSSFNTKLEMTSLPADPVTVSDYRPQDSRLYIPFSITASMHLAGAIPLLVIYLRARRKTRKKSQNKPMGGSKRITRELSLGFKILVLGSICLYMFVYCAIEDSFHSFLTTFCVRYMGWTKTEGSFATSLFWTAFGIGRFLGIWIIKFISPSKLLGGFSIALGLVFAALLAFSQTMIHSGIWACSIGAGAGMSIIFPTVFTWTEERLLPVSGKIASLIMVFCSFGSMANPIIIGFLMDTESPIWFSYVLFGECILLVILYFSVLYIARLCDKKYGTSYKDVSLEIKMSEDTAEKDDLMKNN